MKLTNQEVVNELLNTTEQEKEYFAKLLKEDTRTLEEMIAAL